jgi:hypothetical protein
VASGGEGGHGGEGPRGGLFIGRAEQGWDGAVVVGRPVSSAALMAVGAARWRGGDGTQAT